MKNDAFEGLQGAAPSRPGRRARAGRDEAYNRYRLLAVMAQGTAAALLEAWRSYRNVEEARIGARAMLLDDSVLRVAIVGDRIPLQLIEWVIR
jgi:hypothetical protein